MLRLQVREGHKEWSVWGGQQSDTVGVLYSDWDRKHPLTTHDDNGNEKLLRIGVWLCVLVN